MMMLIIDRLFFWFIKDIFVSNLALYKPFWTFLFQQIDVDAEYGLDDYHDE